MHDKPTLSPLVRVSFRPKWGEYDETEGFVYLAYLTTRDFSRLFASLFLPRDEWRDRLGAHAFDALPSLPVYVDPVTKKPCHLGEDIRVAQRAMLVNDPAFRTSAEYPALPPARFGKGSNSASRKQMK